MNKKILGDTGASETGNLWGRNIGKVKKGKFKYCGILYILPLHHIHFSIQSCWTTWNSQHTSYSSMQSVSRVKNVLLSSFSLTLVISNSYSSFKHWSFNLSLNPFTVTPQAFGHNYIVTLFPNSVIIVHSFYFYAELQATWIFYLCISGS